MRAKMKNNKRGVESERKRARKMNEKEWKGELEKVREFELKKREQEIGSVIERETVREENGKRQRDRKRMKRGKYSVRKRK